MLENVNTYVEEARFSLIAEQMNVSIPETDHSIFLLFVLYLVDILF